MDSIPGSMAISDARANLTDTVNAVHLQDRKVLLHRRGKAQAVLLPPDFDQLIQEIGGVQAARDALRAQIQRG
jgi:PHD/YefM family antitoxin component YafN of YafNO toxin-antitoxin module